MPPKTQLEKIAELSPTLHAALQAVLHDVPFSAQRVFGCCGMDTDHLVYALETAIYRVKHKSDGSSSINQVLELLRHVHGVRVEELLLGKSTAIKPENCQRMLTLWFEAEVLFDQVDSWLEKYVSINKSFGMALSSYDVKSLAGLIECLKEFNARDTALVICLRSYEELVGKIKTTKEQLEMLDGAVGKIAALTLLDLAREKIEKAAREMSLTTAVRNLQTQRAALNRLITVYVEYCEEFSGYSRRSMQMGGGILELMRLRITDLLDVLSKYGVDLWLGSAQYLQEVNSGIIIDLASIPERVRILGDVLREQQRLLNELIADNPNGLKIGGSGMFLQNARRFNEIVARSTDFLRISSETSIEPAARKESVSTVSAAVIEETPAREIAATILEQMIVAATAVNYSASAAIPTVTAASADSVSPERVVVHVTEPVAVPAVHTRFFPAPSSSLTEEQKDRIDEFLGKLKDCASFTDKQLSSVCWYLTGLIEKHVTDADRTIFQIATRLSVTVRWIDDHEIREKIGELLNPIASVPSPQ